MLSNNDYNNIIRSTLFSAVEAYINLRKVERSIKQIQEAFIVYDDLLRAYQELFLSGGTTWREYERIRAEKWDYESELYNLENSRMSLQGELYRFNGVLIKDISDEGLVEPDHDVFTQIFSGLSRKAISSLDRVNLNLRKENLRMNHILDRQTNSPAFKASWGASYILPVKSPDSLWDAWNEKDNFYNNILNNWSITSALDLSPLLSFVNHKNSRQYNEEIKLLDELLKKLVIDKAREKLFAGRIIEQLEEQIATLSLLVVNENNQLNENETLRNAGAITALEYNQARLKLNEKKTVLLNLQDDLWFYKFIDAFYFTE
jgi:outer membrane protein TolC